MPRALEEILMAEVSKNMESCSNLALQPLKTYLYHNSMVAKLGRVVTKLGKVVTYYEGPPSAKSYDPLITWSSEITSQTKSSIPPLPQCPWPPNLAR